MNENLKFTVQKIPVQIALGFLGAVLNWLLSMTVVDFLKWPLFFDCIFTIAFSFFGLLSGAIAAVFFHVVSIFVPIFGRVSSPQNMFFAICSLSVAFSTYYFCRNKVSVLRLVLLSLFLTVIISFEGGLIFSFVFNRPDIATAHSVDKFLSTVIYQGVYLVVGATLMRIPINLIDKTLSVVLGFFIALGLERLFRKFRAKKLNTIG